MITNNEIQISNMSYTNRDFATIYPELLDLTKKLTNKWDPSVSNESDPGNVLLKLAAAVGDKSNYNIDKNVLECFMPSATQETSMRMLTEAVGYNMKYYQSAMTDISFKYTADFEGPVTFNRFSTVVANSDDTVAYTLIKDVTIDHKNIAASGAAIEGLLETLTVGDSEIIKLENLDDNHKLYFPETYVAENGVFITNDGYANFDEWKKVDNLNVQQPLTRCYRFGYDSVREAPYIEFPSDIAQLIGAGLRVGYIITSGDAGNIQAGALSVLKSTTVTTLDFDNLIVFNPASSTNGHAKETIDEAYNNFKRIIGTFETLVTTRDYANALYNSRDEYNNPYVSNAAVADRTDDFNYALKVVSYDNRGQYTKLVTVPDTSETDVPNGLGVSDLSLYPLKPYKAENYTTYNPTSVYKDSFMPLKQLGYNNTYYDDEVLVGEDSDIENSKCIGHNFVAMPSDTIYGFKNLATLDLQIFTYTKVNAVVQAEIKSNVIKALSDNFNARLVDYGYEIPYDRILDVVYAADSRIKSVNLAEPVYTPKVFFANGEEEFLYNEVDISVDIVAKNVLGGKLSLFLFDSRFDWQFGQVDGHAYDNLLTVSTELDVPITDGAVHYTVDENELIQLLSPSLSTRQIYPAGVYYRFTSTRTSTTREIVPANSDYKLSADETLKLYYIDSEGQTYNITLSGGSMIRPSFGLHYISAYSDTTPIEFNNETLDFVRIGTNDTLETREYVQVKLTSLGTPIYWIRNNQNNELFAENQTETILDSNEYFIYSNSNLDDLVILGSGTRIVRGGEDADLSQWIIHDTISLENINVNGLGAFTSGDWQYKQFTATNYVQLQEMQVVNLGPGVTLNITDWATSRTALTNTFTSCSGQISYNYGGVTTTLPRMAPQVGSWLIRTRLDINAGPDKPQQVINNADKSQSFVFTMPNQQTLTIDTNTSFVTNYPVSIAGGSDIDLLVVNLLTGSSAYTLSAYVFTPEDATLSGSPIDTTGIINVTLDATKTLFLPLSIEKINTTQPDQAEIAAGLSADGDYHPFGTYIVPLLVDREADPTATIEIQLSSNCANLYQYNTYNDEYTVLTNAPADWSTNWTAYYTYDSGTDTYNPVTGATAPVFASSTYFVRTRTKQTLDEITESGLYMLELVANWLGEYETWRDLNSERPASVVIDGNTVYPNQDGDVCKVLTTSGGKNAGLYQWVASNSTWTLISDTAPADYNLTIAITVTGTRSIASFLSVGQIYKVYDLNPAIMAATDGFGVLERIADLTADLDTPFYYVYTPSNNDVIETANILSAQAFWDVNNIVNKFTLPQLDLDNSQIYIARASQL